MLETFGDWLSFNLELSSSGPGEASFSQQENLTQIANTCNCSGNAANEIKGRTAAGDTESNGSSHTTSVALPSASVKGPVRDSATEYTRAAAIDADHISDTIFSATEIGSDFRREAELFRAEVLCSTTYSNIQQL